jgi:hypothetical protein
LTDGVTTTRRLRPLAALALTALIGAGCSHTAATNGTSASTAANGTATNLEKGVQFAQCMRTNGVGNFPDPGPSGQFTIDGIANGSGVDTNSTVFQQALSACKGLEPPGFIGSPRTASQQEASLEFARCVRDHGVPDFPDPTPDGPLVDTNRIPSSATPGGMTSLNAAMRSCSSFAAAAGVTGGK